MKQIIYLVRHAEPNYDNHDDINRELTPKGLQDCQRLIDYFRAISIDQIYSSPYKRALQTIQPLATARQLPINTRENLRERKVDSVWIDDFEAFLVNQWQDFTFKLSDGESLQEVQKRQLEEVKTILKDNKQHTIISSHGTAIATILAAFDKQFGLDDFQRIKTLFPFVAVLQFDHRQIQSIHIDNIFTGECHARYLI